MIYVPPPDYMADSCPVRHTRRKTKPNKNKNVQLIYVCYGRVKTNRLLDCSICDEKTHREKTQCCWACGSPLTLSKRGTLRKPTHACKNREQRQQNGGPGLHVGITSVRRTLFFSQTKVIGKTSISCKVANFFFV